MENSWKKGASLAEERITIEMEGSEEDGGDVRLGDFLDELAAVQAALRRTQQWVTADVNPVSYRIAELSHSSPSRVTIAIIPRTPLYSETPRRISRRFTYALRTVRRRHRYAQSIDSALLESLVGVGSPLEKRMKTVKISRTDEPEIRIDREFVRNLQDVMMDEFEERDEIIGVLDALNIHDKAQFHIYPSIGPQKILCRAKLSDRGKISANAGRKVAVDGWALYKKDAPFPHAMRVLDIEPLPSDEELPRLSDLHGIAPDAIGGLAPEDFVRGFRDANW